MPRVKLFDEEQALLKAQQLFWTKGYEATSLTDLTRHLEIGKGSFYDTFGSKQQLFDRCLSRYSSDGIVQMETIIESFDDPIEGLRHLVNNHTKLMLEKMEGNGCFMANSSVELSKEEKLRPHFQMHNASVKKLLADYINRDPWHIDAEVLADVLIMHFTSISVMSKFMEDSDRIRKVNSLFIQNYLTRK